MREVLEVRHVRGRYPHGPTVLHSENVIASVQEVGPLFHVRLDDCANPEAWLEIVIEVSDPVIEEKSS